MNTYVTAKLGVLLDVKQGPQYNNHKSFALTKKKKEKKIRKMLSTSSEKLLLFSRY